jgi:3-hydroxyisobutyrate dehydrogenase
MSGPDGIASSSASPIVIDMCTLPIDAKESARDALAAAGKILLDCPVSGTGAQAARKDLFVFGSGERQAYDSAQHVFAGMSRVQKYVGPFGDGSRMKFIANHLVNIHNVAAAEALVLARKAGLDAQMVYEVMADSAGASRMLQVRGPLMVAGTYERGSTCISRISASSPSSRPGSAAQPRCSRPLRSSITRRSARAAVRRTPPWCARCWRIWPAFSAQRKPAGSRFKGGKPLPERLKRALQFGV